jgi:hypothetical protein
LVDVLCQQQQQQVVKEEIKEVNLELKKQNIAFDWCSLVGVVSMQV